jgi:hypothetical protein
MGAAAVSVCLVCIVITEVKIRFQFSADDRRNNINIKSGIIS